MHRRRKVIIFVLVLVLVIGPTLDYRRWVRLFVNIRPPHTRFVLLLSAAVLVLSEAVLVIGPLQGFQ